MPGLTSTKFILYLKGLENTRLVFTYPLHLRLTEHAYRAKEKIKVEPWDGIITAIYPRISTGLFNNEDVDVEVVVDNKFTEADIEKYHGKWFVFLSKAFPAGWILQKDQCLV